MTTLSHVVLLESLLGQLENNRAGLLVGLPRDGQVILVDVAFLQHDKCADVVHQASCEALPQGLSYAGVIARDEVSAVELVKRHEVQRMLQHQQHGMSGCVIAFPAAPSDVTTRSASAWTFKLLQQQNQQANHISVETLKAPEPGPLAWVGKGHVLVRCSVDLQLSVFMSAVDMSASSSGTATTSTMDKPLASAVGRLEEQILSSSTVFVAQRRDGRQMLLTEAAPGVASDLVTAAAGNPGFISSPVTATAVVQPAPGSVEVQSAPVYDYAPVAGASSSGTSSTGAAACCSAVVHLDVLCYVPASMPLAQLPAQLLRPALSRQLRGVQRVVAAQGRVCGVSAHHFLPPGRSHHVTVLYPTLVQDADLNEAKLAPYRKELHKLLGLPDNRPALRLSMALDVSKGGDSGSSSQRLRDVHLGLVPPVAGGTVYLVDGSYDYHHYMQDRFNDNGWGCAYRSLQTIVSWFRVQQYTNKPVPGHRDIQQTLVKLGDKASNFVGSSNWIGAIELSYVLDDYLGVTSKIITVNKGSEIPQHARELAAHFRNQGTPIMIGGGVLAYTLLGVQFNEQTGECAFLILDPHYTGGEDLKKIQSGTWVGWKRADDNAAAGGPLFVKDAFYNFLCPQRPNTV